MVHQNKAIDKTKVKYTSLSFSEPILKLNRTASHSNVKIISKSGGKV